MCGAWDNTEKKMMHLHKLLIFYVITSLLILVLSHVWKFRRYYSLGFKIKGPPGWPIFGNCLNFVGSSLDHISKAMTRVYEENRHEPIFRVWLGTNLAVFPTDPDMIKHVLANNLHKAPCYEMLSGSTGQGLIQHRNLPKWRKHRRIIGASFQFSALKANIRLFHEEAAILVDKMKPLAISKESFEPNHLVGLAALSSLMRTSFGVDFQIQQSRHSHHPYTEAVESSFKIFVMRIFKPWLIIDFFYKILGYKAQVRKNRAIQKDFIEKIIQAAKEKIIKEQQTVSNIVPKLRPSGNKGANQPSPFVEQVLKDKMNTGKYHDHDLSHSELLHEMVTLLNAGFDTVTITISVILNILALHPNLQQDVFVEIENVLDSDDSTPTYDQLQNLNLLTRVIKESMRLFPAAPLIGRSSPHDIECGGYTIPAGASIGIFIYGIHRDPRYWPNPETFDADRFLPSEVAKRNPNAYLPFSLGARNCIGNKYAMFQMKITISTLLRRYKILPGDNCRSMEDIRFEFGLTMRPLPGNDVRLEMRSC